MVRYRSLSKKGNRFVLTSIFDPGQNDDEFLFGERMGCIIVFDFSRIENKITVGPLRFSKCVDLPPLDKFYEELSFDPGIPKCIELPPLDKIQEELIYLFNLFNSLSPYETSQRTPPQSSDFKEISD